MDRAEGKLYNIILRLPTYGPIVRGTLKVWEVNLKRNILSFGILQFIIAYQADWVEKARVSVGFRAEVLSQAQGWDGHQ